VKNLDLISSNSGSTLDKAISNTYNIYTEYKNDSVIVNFGDGQQQTIILSSSNIILYIFAWKILF